MQKQYYVSGRYQARYANGYYTGDIGISARVKAKSEKAAKKVVSKKAMKDHDYIQFNWLNVDARPLE